MDGQDEKRIHSNEVIKWIAVLAGDCDTSVVMISVGCGESTGCA